MNKKKEIPLVVLTALQPFVKLKGERFDVVDPKDNLLNIIDIDIDSSFHFRITKYKLLPNNRNFEVLVNQSPRSYSNIGEHLFWVDTTELNKQFNFWLELLKEYDNVDSFFDDPIIKSFEEEFFAEFEFVDADSETQPLKTKQILLLDSYLEDVSEKLNEHITSKNTEDIQDIKEDIEVLRENLTLKPKKWAARKLSNIWAKIAKQGPKFIRTFLSETGKQIVIQGVSEAMKLL